MSRGWVSSTTCSGGPERDDFADGRGENEEGNCWNRNTSQKEQKLQRTTQEGKQTVLI